MNRKDAEMLAVQYARRRIRENVPAAEATRMASDRFGLSTAAEIRVVKLLRKESK